jgi:ornithine decarboxylase
MKNNTSEPPGRQTGLKLARRTSVINLPKDSQIATAISPAMHAPVVVPVSGEVVYHSVEAMVHSDRPVLPVHCLRPSTIVSTAKWFLRQFPGEVMYAVKTNPDPRVLRYLAHAGVKHFDVASIVEVKQVADTLPDAKMYFMHPVKSREAIASAYFEYGVRDFSLDSHEELNKILEVTHGATDLNLYVRLAMANENAAFSLAGKFGVSMEDAPALILAARAASAKLGICFHVGSQCMDPQAYGRAVQHVVDLLDKTGVKLDILDIGGGFPSIYPGLMPPALPSYMKAIKKTLKSHPQLSACKIVCEPGRALVAEGGSVVVRVELRKGNMLYINDGTYGSLFDAGHPGFVYPVKAIRPEGQGKEKLSPEVAEFGFFGPTCDSLDTMKGPFHLPKDIAEGDWIEIGQLGSYGATMRTNFNGFYSDATVEVADKPLLSIFGVN